MDKAGRALEIEGPSAVCGYCRFTSALQGAWSVEDGLLVWRAAPDPQPRRGPDLHGCCEGRECGEFSGVEADDQVLSAEDVAALRASAEEAQRREMEEWERP
jgi:hypothetical protein